jgi:hypothetical protein
MLNPAKRDEAGDLQGEIDATPERQAAADAARAEQERQAEVARATPIPPTPKSGSDEPYNPRR